VECGEKVWSVRHVECYNVTVTVTNDNDKAVTALHSPKL
jgi:hypothetical protein